MRPAGSDSSSATSLLDTIENQRLGCELAGSALYGELLHATATDVAAGGVCARLLAPVASAPFGDAVLLRFLAAVHVLVLEGTVPDLATQYPSVGGTPTGDAGALFLGAVRANEAAIAGRLGLGVQTNEPGRSAALIAGYLELGRAGLPLRVLEVGASAGLNLRFDRFRYEADGQGFGPPDSPMRFVGPWVGRAPDLSGPIEVASRRGCDVDPIDPTTPAGRLRLRSYVWPDQPERRARLDAALAVAAELPVAVDRADAVSWLRERLAAPVPGTVTVVVHSITFQYLSPDDRRAFLDLLDEAGARATAAAPLAWLRMEPGGDQAETRLTTWPDGQTRLLCRSAFHGPPVVWLGASEAPA